MMFSKYLRRKLASLNSAVLVDVNTFGAGADRSAIMNRDRTQCLSNEWWRDEKLVQRRGKSIRFYVVSSAEGKEGWH
jgi:hypothetical protein